MHCEDFGRRGTQISNTSSNYLVYELFSWESSLISADSSQILILDFMTLFDFNILYVRGPHQCTFKTSGRREISSTSSRNLNIQVVPHGDQIRKIFIRAHQTKGLRYLILSVFAGFKFSDFTPLPTSLP